MEIYKLMKDGYIQRQSDLALIPPTELNKDYLQYLEDAKNGAEISNFDYEAEEKRQLIAVELLEKEQKTLELKTNLEEIDKKSIRAIRTSDIERIETLEKEAEEIRIELRKIS